MTKKSLSKLLSVILALAICSATVLGCLITANATDVECYTWSDGDVADDLTSATINLNLTAPATYLDGGIYWATFSVASENDALVLESVELTGGTRVDGSAFDVNDWTVDYTESASIVDVYTSEIADNASSLKLALTFSFAEGVATQGVKYYSSIANLEMTDGFDGVDGDGHYISYTGAGSTGLMNAGCDHVFDVTGLEAIQTNAVAGYYVYKDVPCANGCGTVNEYQVVPATTLENIVYWDGTVSETLEGTGTEADPFIIKTPADLAILTNKTVTGGYYKVADGIDAFVLQSEAHAAVLELVDFEQTRAYFANNKSTVAAWKNGGTFKGHFDGNGVVIYGMYSTNSNGGLFSTVSVGEDHSSIKNLTVKNSYVTGGSTSSALVGRAIAGYSYTVKEATATGYVKFEKVVLANNYVFNTWRNNLGDRLGLMLASAAAFVNVEMDSCLVYGNHIEGYYKMDAQGNTDTTVTVEGGLFGVLSKGHNGTNHSYQNGIYKNSIILDCVPYAANQDILSAYNVSAGITDANGGRANHAFRPDFFSNIYTNCTSDSPPVSIANWYKWSNYEGKIITLDKASFKGNNAADIVETLNTAVGSEVWVVDENGGYPMFNKELITVGGGDILCGRGEPDYITGAQYSQGNYMTDLVAIKAGTASEELVAKYGEGTEANPFLIYNANHLRTIVQYFDKSLMGSYFKVADGISAFVLQNTWTTDLDTILSTPDSQLTTVLKDQWQNGTDTNTWANAVPFCGHIDFNNITIYGLYNLGGGLIAKAQGHVSIKNLAIKKSYISRNGYVAALIAETTVIDKTTAGNEGSVTIENCSITDSYIEGKNATSGPGIFLGYTGNGYQDTNDANGNGSTTDWVNGPVVIKNCFAEFESGCFVAAGTVGGLAAMSGTNNISISNCVTLGVKPFTHSWTTWQGSYQHYLKPGAFQNVYTDQSTDGGNLNGTVQNYTGRITQINAADLEGAAAVDTLAGFDFENVWSYDGNGGYPTPIAQGEVLSKTQFNLNLLAVNNSYNDDGTFNFNFYYAPTGDTKPVLYIGRADGNGFDAIEPVEIGEAEAEQLGVEVGTLKYSVETISSREIGDSFLATSVANVGSSVAYGKTEVISPADYAVAILQDPNQSVEERQVAAALLGYGTSAKTSLETKLPANATKKNIVYVGTGGIAQTAPTKGSGSKDDPYIIENASHLRYLAQKSTPETTYGKYYKVDPTIDILVFQKEEYIKAVAGSLDSFLALDAEGVKAALSTESGRITFQSGSSGSAASAYDGFAGSIDFSGITICGMYTQNGGLFTYVNGGAGFSNLTIRNNYITSGWFNGNLIGYVHSGSAPIVDSNSKNVYRQLTINNIVVRNCYQTTTANGWSNTGVLIGSATNAKNIPMHISNIITFDNISLGQKSSSDATMMDGALYGALPSSYNGDNDGVPNANFNNIVTLDCVPYPIAGGANNQSTKPAYWHNVYTTKLADFPPCSWYPSESQWSLYDVTKLTSADLAIGGAAKTNMPKLDWTNVWCVNKSAYPTPILSDVEIEVPGSVIYWNGTYDTTLADNGETGTADNPIIIDTAEELYQLTNNTGASTSVGKYYRMADGIDTIVLQPEGTLDLSKLLICKDSSEVAAYFESIPNLSNWNTDYENWFDGNFDGNGVTIMGMYSNARSAGLFPTADGGVPDNYKEDNTGITIGNFTLKNSYVLANSGNKRAGAIVGGTPSNGYGNKVDGIINFEKVVVANCYVESTGGSSANAGVMLGVTGNEIVRVNNCLVYGTKAYYTSGGTLHEEPLYNGYNGRKARDESGAQIDDTFIDNTVSNSIILGVRPYGLTFANRVSNARCLTNVYTDQSTNPYPSTDTYTEANLKAVTADALIGSGAADVIKALNTVAGKTVWYVGNSVDGMPGITKSSEIPNAFATEYANVKFEEYNDYGTATDQFGLYSTSLTLKNNPYMSLSFAFGKEDGVDGINYKHNRDKITIQVRYDSDCDGELDATIEATPPAYDGNYISDVDGWSNKKGSGRFHSYKLELPVYALASDIEVLVTYDDGETIKTALSTVSVSGFGNELDTAYKTLPCDYYSTRIDAVKSLLFYIQALQAKFK